MNPITIHTSRGVKRVERLVRIAPVDTLEGGVMHWRVQCASVTVAHAYWTSLAQSESQLSTRLGKPNAHAQ